MLQFYSVARHCKTSSGKKGAGAAAAVWRVSGRVEASGSWRGTVWRQGRSERLAAASGVLCRPRCAVASMAAAKEELLASAGLARRMAELLEVRRGDLEARGASSAAELSRGWWTSLGKKVDSSEAKTSTGH